MARAFKIKTKIGPKYGNNRIHAHKRMENAFFKDTVRFALFIYGKCFPKKLIMVRYGKTKNAAGRYGTVRYGHDPKFELPNVLFPHVALR